VRGPIDVVVQNSKRKMIVDFVFGFSGIAVAAIDLLKLLDEKRIMSLFHIGAVRAGNGTVLQNFVTLRAKAGPVYIRGDEHSVRRICPECGRLVYLATGQAYLCGLGRQAAILQSSSASGALIIRSDVFDATLGGRPLSHVRLRSLDVRDSSSDGLPVLIDEVVRFLGKGRERAREHNPE
jgi:hypothetical protein